MPYTHRGGLTHTHTREGLSEMGLDSYTHRGETLKVDALNTHTEEEALSFKGGAEYYYPEGASV